MATSKWSRKIAGVTIEADVRSRTVDGKVQFHAGSLIEAEGRGALLLARSGLVNGELFAFLRKNIPMRAKDLGELLGVAETTISRWENGQRPVDRASFEVVCSLVEDSLAGATTAPGAPESPPLESEEQPITARREALVTGRTLVTAR